MMDVRVIPDRIENYSADAIIVSLFEGVEPNETASAVDGALGGAIQELISAGDFSGKAGQTAVLYTRGAIPAKRVILIGLGKLENFTAEVARRAAASAILKARDLKAAHVATAIHGAPTLAVDESVSATVEGSLLALYSYRGLKGGDAPEPFPKQLDIISGVAQDGLPLVGLEAGKAIAEGVLLARELVNLPPNVCTPIYLAETAAQMAGETGLKVEILEQAQMEALKMGALLGVSQGSDTPPRFIILEHNGEREDLPTIVLVGKGVTFDTGGYNLKTGDGMSTMKGDMAGGAAVIGAMRAVAGLKPDLRVIGLIPTADNMISGHAYRAQDVLTASNGVTIEIISTDAEGRLLLADALVYAERYKPAAVVDIATLTGAAVTALGMNVASGLFSTDDNLRDALIQAGSSVAEKVWPLPLFPEYDKTIESNTADIKNSGGARGGVGTSAAFLKRFASGYPAWAHIDMAGMTWDTPDTPYAPKGASGYGVRLLTAFLRGWK